MSQLVKNKLIEKIEELDKEKAMHLMNPEKDFSRKRKLSFKQMIHTIISMGAGSIKDELLDTFDYDPSTPTTSAFVQQRNKIKSTAFESLFHKFNNTFASEQFYKKYRLLAIDGCSLSIFADPKDTDNFYKRINQDKGFSNLHLNACYDLLTRRFEDIIINPGSQRGEKQAIREMVGRYESGHKTIFIADRGYESYNTFSHIEHKSKNYLIRVKDKDSNGILSALDLPDKDEFDLDFQIILTRKQTKKIKQNPHIYKFMPSVQKFDFMDDNQEKLIKFRVLRFKLSENSYEAIITNLDRHSFSPLMIKELYHLRWGIESSFRHLKYVVGLSCFHAKKVESIKQEIFAKLLLHNFCEIITAKTVISKKNTKHLYQLNFTRAFRICRQFLRSTNLDHPPDVEKLISRELLPVRPHRFSPRKVRTRSHPASFLYRIT